MANNEDLLRIQQLTESLSKLGLTGKNLERLQTLLARVGSVSQDSGANLNRLASGLQRLYDQLNAPTQTSVRVFDNIQMRVKNASREVERLRTQLASLETSSALNITVDVADAQRQANAIKNSPEFQEVQRQAAQLKAEREGVSVPEAKVDLTLPASRSQKKREMQNARQETHEARVAAERAKQAREEAKAQAERIKAQAIVTKAEAELARSTANLNKAREDAARATEAPLTAEEKDLKREQQREARRIKREQERAEKIERERQDTARKLNIPVEYLPEKGYKNLRSISEVFRTQTSSDQINKILADLGVKNAVVNGAVGDPTRGISRVGIAAIDETTGIINQLTVTIDRLGNVSLETTGKLTAQEKQSKLEQERIAKAASLGVPVTSLPKQGFQNLQTIESIITDPYSSGQLQEQLKRGGMEGALVSKARRFSNIGLTQLDLEKMDDATGVMQQMTALVDRFGNVTIKTARSMQPFSQAIGKDVIEFAKWSIAASLILIPLQKIGELTQEMIANQQKLADIMIVLNKTQSDQNEIFNAASRIANETGETMAGVLDAYTIAYRATGSVTDETERFRQTNVLLRDSLILSKLSTLEQAEAIDILAAGLIQTGKGFDEGVSLLNKWVAVSKVANVDLTTLATGFSVLGDSAEGAGLSVDETNALLATISSTGSASGKEVANTARAIIGGFQSDKARKELESLGFSLQDSEGNIKSFTEVMDELVAKKGLMSDLQFQNLTMALGGGTRRQAVWASFIEAYERMKPIIDASSRATGDTDEAMAALQIQTETVATSTIRLGNAFSYLAQTLGTKNGILDSMKVLLDISTLLVKALDALSQGAGRSLIPMLATVGMGIYANAKGPTYQGIRNLNIATALSGGKRFGSEKAFNFWTAGSSEQTNALPPRIGALISAGLLATTITGNAVDKTATKDEKWARIIGDAIGAAAGFALTRSPVGAAVGMSIGEAFVNSVFLYKLKFEDFFTSTFNGQKPEPENETEREKLDRERDEFANSIRDWEGVSQVGIAEEKFAQSLVGNKLSDSDIALLQATGNATPFTFGTWGGGYSFYGADRSGTQEDLERLKKVMSGDAKPQNEKEAALAAQYREFDLRAIALDPDASTNQDYFIELTKQTSERDADLISSTQEKYRKQLREQLVNREISPSEYAEGVLSMSNLNMTGTQWYTAYGSEYGQKMGMSPEQVYSQMGNLAAYGSDEDIKLLNDFTDEIAEQVSIMDRAGAGTEEYSKALSEKNRLVGEAITLQAELNKQLLATVEIPTTIDLSEYNNDEIALILQRAQAEQGVINRGRLNAGVFESEEQMNAWTQNLPELLIRRMTDFQKQGGLETSTISDVIEMLTKESKIKDKSMGFSSYDMTYEEYLNALDSTGAYANLKGQLEEKGVNVEEEPMALIFEDGVRADKRNWNIAQYLLRTIIDNQEEQIEGLYNFPADMFAFVSYDAMRMSKGATVEPGTGTGTGTGAGAGAGAGGETPYFRTNEEGIYRNRNAWTPPSDQELPYPKPSQPWESVKAQIYLANEKKRYRNSQFSGGGMDYYTAKMNGDLNKPAMTQYGIGAGHTGTASSLWDIIKGTFLGTRGIGVGVGLGAGTGTNVLGNTQTADVSGAMSAIGGIASTLTDSVKNLSTQLSIQIDNRTSLIVDGRQLAQIVKRHMKDDLVRYGNAGSAVTRVNVI
jgi:TP901 family phage tail tape measure protein